MLLLDTHVIIWAINESSDLGTQCKALLQKHKNELYVSAFSFWECELLIQKGRISLPHSTETIRQALLKQGVKEIPVTGDIGILSCQLDLHGDPADRIIVATALQKKATLLTADLKILNWDNQLERFNARK